MAEKFVSRPVEIEAVQFTGKNQSEIVTWTEGEFYEIEPEDRGDDPDIVASVYDRLHSTYIGVNIGDWIIKGTKGEFYPCIDEVFRDKYEWISD